MENVLFVGDVHGCADELSDLIALARADRVVLVGDLFTKGPDPVGVWHLVQAHRAQAVLGNHDARLIEAFAGNRPQDAHAHEVIAKLDADDGSWRRWISALPLFDEVAGWTVVHAGLHPSGELSKTTRSMAISMRRYPADVPDSPLWHASYTGERRVVFGHDAKRGLVRIERGGQPWVVGLDSGCVYGGVLSGFLPAYDRLVQVPARRVWRAIDAPSQSRVKTPQGSH